MEVIKKLTSNFSDTLWGSFNRALSCFGLCVGRGEAGEAEDQEGDGETHDDVDADVCEVRNDSQL